MPCGAAIVQHARDGSSGSARRASTDERCARIPRMGRCAPPQDRVLLSPAYEHRHAVPAPHRAVWEVRRGKQGQSCCCAMGGSTTLFRAVLWALPHPCLPAYSFYIEPKSLSDRALSCTELGTASGRWLWSLQG